MHVAILEMREHLSVTAVSLNEANCSESMTPAGEVQKE